MLGSPLASPAKTGYVRFQLAGLLFGISLLFLVSVLAVIAAHQQVLLFVS